MRNAPFRHQTHTVAQSRGALVRAFYYTAIIEDPGTRPVDQIVLFSGDGDFRSLVEAVQRRGVYVTVISSISCRPAMIADELRRQADPFIDLLELRTVIGGLWNRWGLDPRRGFRDRLREGLLDDKKW
jgi:hypothetical protein